MTVSQVPDPVMAAAQQLVQDHPTVSVSYLQRRLQIGRPLAERVSEQLRRSNACAVSSVLSQAGFASSVHGGPVCKTLAAYLRPPFCGSPYATSLSHHDAVKAQLYEIAYRQRLRPVLEAAAWYGNRAGRIDCLMLAPSGDVVAGIEIDGTVRRRSVDKLSQLPANAERIIVSLSGRRDSLDARLASLVIEQHIAVILLR